MALPGVVECWSRSREPLGGHSPRYRRRVEMERNRHDSDRVREIIMANRVLAVGGTLILAFFLVSFFLTFFFGL